MLPRVARNIMMKQWFSSICCQISAAHIILLGKIFYCRTLFWPESDTSGSAFRLLDTKVCSVNVVQCSDWHGVWDDKLVKFHDDVINNPDITFTVQNSAMDDGTIDLFWANVFLPFSTEPLVDDSH